MSLAPQADSLSQGHLGPAGGGEEGMAGLSRPARAAVIQGLGKAGLSPEQHSHPISWERGLHVQHGNCPGSPAALGACETSILSAGSAAPHTGRKLTRPRAHTHACARAT